jgi:hypothetical protein
MTSDNLPRWIQSDEGRHVIRVGRAARARILRALGRVAESDAADRRSRAIGAELGLKDFAP